MQGYWSDQCISPQPPCFWYRDAVSKRISDNNSIRFQSVSHEYQIYPPTQARWDFKLHRNYSNCATIFGRGQRVFKIIVWRKFFQKLFQTRYYTVKKDYFFILDSGSTRSYDCSSAIHIFFMNHNLEISIVAKWVEPESKFQNGDFLTVQWVHRKHSDMKNKCFLESWPSMVSTENHRKRCRFWTEIEANCSTEVIECWTPYLMFLVKTKIEKKHIAQG